MTGQFRITVLDNDLYPLCHRCNVSSLSEIYFNSYGKWADEHHCFVPPFQTSSVRWYYTTTIQSNHPYCLYIQNVRNFQLDRIFPRTTILWNRFPHACFPAHFNLDLFKSKIQSWSFLLIVSTSDHCLIRYNSVASFHWL